MRLEPMIMSGFDAEALVKKAHSVASKADFTEFAKLLLQNYRSHPEKWDNASVEELLDGLVGFVGDMEGYYKNARIAVDLERPSWRVFADILMAARVYE